MDTRNFSDTYEEGESVYVVDSSTGEIDPWQVVRKIDTYVAGAHSYPTMYLLKQLVMYAYGESVLHTDVVNVFKMRKM